jgi:sulfur carrier protein
MEITVNHQNYSVSDACSVQQMLIAFLQLQAKGIAIAVNQEIISKAIGRLTC